MPKLIKQGAVVADQWSAEQILSLEQWQGLADKSSSAVQLEPDQPPAPLLEQLADIGLIAINFTVFMDGRGFSYARELREAGYSGELRAVGNYIPDQLHYLQRCGFDSFELNDDTDSDAAMAHLEAFSEHYQAAVDEPQPLFRRRA